MKILLAEDDETTSDYICKGLTEGGFTVDVATFGDEALQLALTTHPDVFILDVSLPVMDGWSVLAELRRQGSQVPVLYLTARDGVADRIKGLDLGADDYLVKPFSFGELLARLRSIIRRRPTLRPDIVECEDLKLDIRGHRASRAGTPLELTPKEFALLLLLIDRRGEVLSRTVIAERIWDMNFDSDTNVIDVHIRRLRAKVDDAHDVKLIHTVRGLGYVIR